MITVPIDATPAQTFVTQLGLIRMVFDIQWNDRTNQFSLSLSNADTDQVYFQGVPMVLGTDYLSPYAYMIGALVLVDESKQSMEATLEDFGTRTKLYWLSEDEANNVISSPV